MKKMLLFLMFVLIVVNCTTSKSIKKGTISKPTMSTEPLSYLDSFPLGKIRKIELFINLGLPDKTNRRNGDIYYSYELGQGNEKREYVYVIENDVVVDVIYNDQHTYSGSRARDRKERVIKGTALKIRN